jgi:hypothetical protein
MASAPLLQSKTFAGTRREIFLLAMNRVMNRLPGPFHISKDNGTLFHCHHSFVTAPPAPAYNSAGREIDAPTVSPQFRAQSTTNTVNPFDDQTLVFGLKENQVQADTALAELDGSQ